MELDGNKLIDIIGDNYDDTDTIVPQLIQEGTELSNEITQQLPKASKLNFFIGIFRGKLKRQEDLFTGYQGKFIYYNQKVSTYTLYLASGISESESLSIF